MELWAPPSGLIAPNDADGIVRGGTYLDSRMQSSAIPLRSDGQPFCHIKNLWWGPHWGTWVE